MIQYDFRSFKYKFKLFNSVHTEIAYLAGPSYISQFTKFRCYLVFLKLTVFINFDPAGCQTKFMFFWFPTNVKVLISETQIFDMIQTENFANRAPRLPQIELIQISFHSILAPKNFGVTYKVLSLVDSRWFEPYLRLRE